MIERKIAKGNIYFGRFEKPTPYFLPIIEVIEKAIISKHIKQYRAIVCVDGIDKKKSEELTKALRSRNIQLIFIKSCRDESKPLIRVADRWAGCIRGASLKQNDDLKMFKKAQRSNYIIDSRKQ